MHRKRKKQQQQKSSHGGKNRAQAFSEKRVQITFF